MNQLGKILMTNIKNLISKIRQNSSSRFDLIENAHFKANISLKHLPILIKLLFYITPEFTTFKRSQVKYFDRKLPFLKKLFRTLHRVYRKTRTKQIWFAQRIVTICLDGMCVGKNSAIVHEGYIYLNKIVKLNLLICPPALTCFLWKKKQNICRL